MTVLSAAVLTGGRTSSSSSSLCSSVSPALAAEAVFTFALAWVILYVATAKSTEGNSYYGLAIGFTIVAAAFAGGGISGGAYNPAVGLGPILHDTIRGGSSIGNAWYYVVGPCVGAVIAVFVFKLQEGDGGAEA